MMETDILSAVVPLCPDGIIGVNRKGTVVIFNDSAENLTGYTKAEVIGKLHITDIYHPPELGRKIKKKLHSPKHGGPGKLESLEVEVTTRHGRKIPIRLCATLIHKGGEEIGSVGFFHDLTPKRELEAELKRLSITDSLTGLFNRRHFHSVLTHELARAKRYHRPLSLTMFDLDQFKQCNDQLGHLEGDNILRLVSSTAHETLRKTDMAFRYGGDEFLFLLPETDLASAVIVAEKFRNQFNAACPYRISVEEEEATERVTLSLGVAQANPDDTGESFNKRVDMAMYEAKAKGGDCTVKAEHPIGTAV
ncbi:MAG: sensor domain-containing diguanylate cyclase [Desulfatiglandaceae bacterium]